MPLDELLLPSASVASWSVVAFDGAALPFVAVEVLPAATVDLLILAICCINSFSSSFKSFLILFL